MRASIPHSIPMLTQHRITNPTLLGKFSFLLPSVSCLVRIQIKLQKDAVIFNIINLSAWIWMFWKTWATLTTQSTHKSAYWQHNFYTTFVIAPNGCEVDIRSFRLLWLIVLMTNTMLTSQGVKTMWSSKLRKLNFCFIILYISTDIKIVTNWWVGLNWCDCMFFRVFCLCSWRLLTSSWVDFVLIHKIH